MKTTWGKPVHVIAFIRTLMIVLAVAVCTVAADDLQTLRKKAEAGDADAQYFLGLAYAAGRSVPEDNAKAVKWYRKAAEQGNASAQCTLGLMYDIGEDVPEDDAEAVKWYRKAAEQGYALAQYRLGVKYAEGEGVPEDDVAAYAWISVAAASGDDEDRKVRDRIKDELTPSQLEKGQVMAREIFERIEKQKAAEGE